MANSGAFSIRQATLDDADDVLACLAEAFAPYRTSYTTDGFLDTILTSELLQRRMESMAVLVAEDKPGMIIGTVACGKTGEGEGHLRGMAVRSAWQGAGVAQTLLERAELQLRAQGCSRVTLDTTLPLERSMRFYEKNGYRRTGKVAAFFGMALIEYEKAISKK
jgi:N-acetylglutamate synthase-like GNAT family acetyltransferase